MENASKALIIAGAILLSIIIVSLGIVVVNNARNSMKNANLDDMEVQTFNSKFTGLTGTTVNGQTINATQLNELLNTVVRSNNEEDSQKSLRYVWVVGSYWSSSTGASKTLLEDKDSVEGKKPTDPKDYDGDISPTKKYLVKPVFGNSGLLWKIKVSCIN